MGRVEVIAILAVLIVDWVISKKAWSTITYILK